MKIISWNINSVRLRLPLLLELSEEQTPDIICLQETKTPDEFFPLDALNKAGYEHIYFKGMKGYNGVAILSRLPFESPACHERTGKNDCRHISVSFKDFELHNIYIPAGGYEADPVINDKFQHKLDFVDELTDWFSAHYASDKPLIALGDFNIAPLENDVWSHKQLLSVVSHTPAETTRLKAFQETLDWVDTARYFVPESDKLYTWWSYRNRDWKKSDRGRRLDHIWVTRPLETYLDSHDVLRNMRDKDKPSDHVPVVLNLKI